MNFILFPLESLHIIPDFMLQLVHVFELLHLHFLEQSHTFIFPDYIVDRTTLLHTFQEKVIHPFHHLQYIHLIKDLLSDQMTKEASNNLVSSDSNKLQKYSHAFRAIAQDNIEKVKQKVSSKL